MKTKCRWNMGAIVAMYLATFAAVSQAETEDKVGFVIGPDQAMRITGGTTLDVLADSLMRQIVTTLSMEVRGKGVSPSPSIGVWRYSLPPGGGPSMRAHREGKSETKHG